MQNMSFQYLKRGGISLNTYLFLDKLWNSKTLFPARWGTVLFLLQ